MPNLDILGVLNNLKSVSEKERPLVMAMSSFDNQRLEKETLDDTEIDALFKEEAA